MIARLFALAALALLAACSPRQALIVLLPDVDGGVGSLSVQDGKGTVLLDKAYAASELRDGAAKPVEIKPEEARQIFAHALGAQPILPARFTLYFQPGAGTLAPEAEQVYGRVPEDIKRRPVHQVEVIGFTDTTGTQDVNQRLSLQRADAVRQLLVRDGVAAGAIATAGRGKLDLAVQTADQVSEPRNRRVVVTVR
jgi:outer membrane protein OmpA-like peptidoglycan-associated protein